MGDGTWSFWKPHQLKQPGTGARTITGGALACEALLANGVTTMFGYPGGAALPFYRELARYPALHHVLVRHEQNAAHAADGYARATGRVGVCVATSGPGATNLLTGPGHRLHGLRAHRRPHRPGRARRHRDPGVSGSRRAGHGRADHQGRIPDHRTPNRSRRSSRERLRWRAKAGLVPCWSIFPRTCSWRQIEVDDGSRRARPAG